ncbi:MAG: DUF3786 domain-containing protein [Clostridiales Family XIII bacterium]|jgi:hypothetical protein|nr:DUF3786 domain-containing protein [Clostridiales Family XIII bacterium]
MKGQMTETPLRHYMGLYRGSDPAEISARTGVAWDAGRSAFSLRLMGAAYEIGFPEFSRGVLGNAYEEILIIRYLLEGRYVRGTGRQLAYAEMPWGPVYMKNFGGRVLERLVGTFGRDPSRLTRAVTQASGLRHEAADGCDVGYRMEFLGSGEQMGLWLSVLLWEGDEEFPASAQVLFDEGFRYAFSAEDIAVVGDVLISRLKGALVVV